MELWIRNALFMTLVWVSICLIIIFSNGYKKWNINRWIVLSFNFLIIASFVHCYKKYNGSKIGGKWDPKGCRSKSISVNDFNSSWCKGNRLNNYYLAETHIDKNSGCPSSANNIFMELTNKCESLNNNSSFNNSSINTNAESSVNVSTDSDNISADDFINAGKLMLYGIGFVGVTLVYIPVALGIRAAEGIKSFIDEM